MPRRIEGKWFVLGSITGLALVAASFPAVSIAAPFQDGPEKSDAPAARVENGAPVAIKNDLYGDPLPPGAIRRFGTVRYRQGSAIHRIAVTSDGKSIVTDGEDNALRVWGAEDGRLIEQFDPDVGALSDFALTSDGKFIMTTGIEYVSGKGGVRHVALHALPSGQASDHGSWNIRGLGWGPLALCPDRKLLALSPKKDAVRIVDAWTGTEECRFEVAGGGVKRIVFSRDGRRMGVQVEHENGERRQQEFKIYDLGAQKEARSILVKDFTQDIDDLALSPDGREIAAALPFVPKIWNIDSGRFFVFPIFAADRISYSADGRFLAMMGGLGQLCTIDTAAHRRKSSVETDCQNSDRIALSPDGRTLFTNGGPNVLHRWDVQTGRDRFAMAEAHSSPVTAMCFTRDGASLITAGKEKTARVWNFATGRQTRALTYKDWPIGIYNIALSADGRTLIAFDSLRLYCWELAKNQEARTSPWNKDPWNGLVAFILEGSSGSVLAATDDGTIRRWSIQDQKDLGAVHLQVPPPAKVGPGRLGALDCAAFLAGGKQLAAIVRHQGLHVFDARTGKGRFQRPEIQGRFLASSPDARTLAVVENGDKNGPKRGSRQMAESGDTSPDFASTSGTVHLVDGETGEILHQIDVPGSPVWGLAFSPDGKTLAATSGWSDGWIHLYDVATGQKRRAIATPPLYPGEETRWHRGGGLIFAPDGRQLVAAMADGSVLAWDVGFLQYE